MGDTDFFKMSGQVGEGYIVIQCPHCRCGFPASLKLTIDGLQVIAAAASTDYYRPIDNDAAIRTVAPSIAVGDGDDATVKTTPEPSKPGDDDDAEADSGPPHTFLGYRKNESRQWECLACHQKARAEFSIWRHLVDTECGQIDPKVKAAVDEYRSGSSKK